MMNVLIVDDDGCWAALCSVLLRPVTTRVRVADTYAGAQKTLARPNGFDVVVLDLDLPDSPPDFTLRRIRSISDSGRKVVVVSGRPIEEIAFSAKAAGAVGCLYKGDMLFAEKLHAICQ